MWQVVRTLVRIGSRRMCWEQTAQVHSCFCLNFSVIFIKKANYNWVNNEKKIIAASDCKKSFSLSWLDPCSHLKWGLINLQSVDGDIGEHSAFMHVHPQCLPFIYPVCRLQNNHKHLYTHLTGSVKLYSVSQRFMAADLCSHHIHTSIWFPEDASFHLLDCHASP